VAEEQVQLAASTSAGFVVLPVDESLPWGCWEGAGVERDGDVDVTFPSGFSVTAVLLPPGLSGPEPPSSFGGDAGAVSFSAAPVDE